MEAESLAGSEGETVEELAQHLLLRLLSLSVVIASVRHRESVERGPALMSPVINHL